MPLRIGIDSYSYHRLLGELRPGEHPPVRRFAGGPLDVIAHALELRVEGVSVETCFLPPCDRFDPGSLRDAAGPLELVLAWGHPHGLEFGASAEALVDLLAWLDHAATLGCSLVRCVAASPRFRCASPVGEQIARTVAPLAAACARADELGVALALENHGDLRAAELLELIERVGHDHLGVCFDTANALRVGDDPIEAAELVAPLIRMVHLKDVAAPGPGTDPVAGPVSVPYGEGVVPIGELLGTLQRAGFDGLACVEVGQLAPGADELALVETCVARLRAYSIPNDAR